MRRLDVVLHGAMSMASVLEAAAIAALWDGDGYARFAIFHVLSSSIVIGRAVYLATFTEARNLPVFVAGIWLFIPGVGPISGAILSVFLRRRFKPEEETMEVLTELMESEKRYFVDLSYQVIARKYSGRVKDDTAMEGFVEPFADILRSNDFEAKRRTVSALRSARTPEAIRLLRVAQNDPGYQIQYLATVALTTIEQDWLDEIQELDREIEANPSEPNLRNEILNAYFRMYSSGIASGAIMRIYIDQAAGHLKRALEMMPDNPDLLIHEGKIEFYRKNYRSAADAFQKALGARPSDPSALFWLAEARYSAGDYEGARESVMRMSQELTVESPVRKKFEPNIRYWSERAPG